MKISLIVLGATLLAAGLFNLNDQANTLTVPAHVSSSFSLWGAKHGKGYTTPAEKMYRLSVFHKNYEMIKEHNNSDSTYTMGLNHFADMTSEEFKSKMLGLRPSNRPRMFAAPVAPNAEIPTSADWRSKMTPVKNQAQCGSCWAFSTVASAEFAWALAGHELTSLSEQQLVDCAGGKWGNMGCNGGLMDQGFDYIIAEGGLTTESNYPYFAKLQTCTFTKDMAAATLTSYVDVPKTEADFLAALSQRVLSVGVDANKWVYYKNGIFEATSCGLDIDHGVAAVGYVNTETEKWVVVRNSWAATWGEEGHIRLALTGDESGPCGVYSNASYPIA